MDAVQRDATGAGLLPSASGTAGGAGGGSHVWAVPVRSAAAGLWHGYRRGGRGRAVHAKKMAQAW